ncbi:MAG TPA: sulfatase/phosphatase domain-containing protein, partial [Prolixibacteraceae bacterium]|nr:sulfatase/phosphatase domain-containing protein [Prolixibacteraceae bacterium]
PNEIKPGSFTEFPGHFIDFMATFVDITEAEYPEAYNGQMITPMKGKSLLPVLKGDEMERDEPLFWEWRQGRAVRDDGWKLVKEGLNKPWELYNMVNDPTETDDLAERFPDKVAELDALFNGWYER